MRRNISTETQVMWVSAILLLLLGIAVSVIAFLVAQEPAGSLTTVPRGALVPTYTPTSTPAPGNDGATASVGPGAPATGEPVPTESTGRGMPPGLIIVTLPPAPGQDASSVAALPPATPTPTSPAPAAVDPAPPPSTEVPTQIPLPLPTTAPVDALPSSAPTDERLAEGEELQRLGDYAAARTRFAALANSDSVGRDVRLAAYFHLVKSYLSEDLFGEALGALDRIEAEFDLAAAAGSVAASPSAQAAENDLRSKVQFLRATALAGLDRHAEAITLYRAFLATHPWMANVVQERIARSYIALGDRDQAAIAYQIAADEATDTVARVVLLETLADTYAAAGRYTDAVAAYDEILAVAQNAPYRALVQYWAGQKLATGGDEAGAVERWRAAIAEAPATQTAHDALVELVNRQVEFDLYQRGSINLAVGSYLPAANAFTAFLESVPADDERVGLALVGLAQAYSGLGNYDAALETANRVLNDYATCACVGQAWLEKARAEAGSGDVATARTTYRTFARDFADDPLAPEALWRSGLLSLNTSAPLEAAIDLFALAETFPTSDRAPQALYYLGMGALRAGLPGQAADSLSRLQSAYPDYRFDATGYWLGRAYEAVGDTASAHAAWQALVDRAPDIYFGVLAAQAIRGLPRSNGAMLTSVAQIAGPASRVPGDDGSRAFAEQWLAQWLQVDASTLATLPAAVAEDRDLATGRLLLELGQRGDALAVLGRLYERHKDNRHALYALSLEFERLRTYRLSLISMSRLLQFSPAGLVENAPIFLQQRVYPRPFAELITQEALANDIDPLLMFSLIRQESLFEEGARSVAAAQGLAQIIPDTGAWIAQQINYPGYTNDLVYRPMINVKFGAYYLDWVREYLDGNLVSALAGYNGGPLNSRNWRTNSGADDTLFVEMIEYNESRVYIQAILSNLYHYTRLYGAR